MTMRAMIRFQMQEVNFWGCSDCAWVFRPSGPPLGNTIEAMGENYDRERDNNFAAHVCAQHPRTKSHEMGPQGAKPRKTDPPLPRKPHGAS